MKRGLPRGLTVDFQPDTGAIHGYDYYQQTKLSRGAVAGKLQAEWIQAGAAGMPADVRHYTYTGCAAAGRVNYFPASQTTFSGRGGRLRGHHLLPVRILPRHAPARAANHRVAGDPGGPKRLGHVQPPGRALRSPGAGGRIDLPAGLCHLQRLRPGHRRGGADDPGCRRTEPDDRLRGGQPGAGHAGAGAGACHPRPRQPANGDLAGPLGAMDRLPRPNRRRRRHLARDAHGPGLLSAGYAAP